MNSAPLTTNRRSIFFESVCIIRHVAEISAIDYTERRSSLARVCSRLSAISRLDLIPQHIDYQRLETHDPEPVPDARPGEVCLEFPIEDGLDTYPSVIHELSRGQLV